MSHTLTPNRMFPFPTNNLGALVQRAAQAAKTGRTMVSEQCERLRVSGIAGRQSRAGEYEEYLMASAENENAAVEVHVTHAFRMLYLVQSEAIRHLDLVLERLTQERAQIVQWSGAVHTADDLLKMAHTVAVEAGLLGISDPENGLTEKDIEELVPDQEVGTHNLPFLFYLEERLTVPN